MAIYLIVGLNDAYQAKLSTDLAKEGPVRAVTSNSWLLASTGTAKDVSERLQIAEGQHGSLVVVEVASYFGRANPDLWSWIASNWEAAPRG